MDLNDGEVRYKIAAVLCDGQLSTSMIHKMIGLALVTFDNQTPSEAAKAFREGTNP